MAEDPQNIDPKQEQSPVEPGGENTNAASAGLEGGTYEIIKNRLQTSKKELHSRLEQLNSERRKVFGTIETSLIANDRINTDNHCIARDIIALRNRVILGYNVFIGLRSEIKLQDVFTTYEFRNNSFHPIVFEELNNERFLTDFRNTYKYYRETIFSKFAIIGPHLFMIFQTGKTSHDIKAFKWLIKDDKLEYLDDRNVADFKYPNQYDFRWQRAYREMHREGLHPHVSILDKVFVETVGGDLTIKVEDNTNTGKGIYAEDVIEKDQTLDDAEYFYADLGSLVALKIKPYQEEFRYFVFNEKVQEVKRIDALENSGVLLPDNQGLIFSNGYYLQTGEFKLFENELRDLKFEKRIQSPNGEDYLYIFFQPDQGIYVLMSYNIIAQQVETPIICNGFTLFPDGELVYFKAEEEATKHHVIQVWQTPYTETEYKPEEYKNNYLYKVGNKDIVRAMAEVHNIINLLNKEDSYANLYDDLARQTMDITDSYFWLNKEEAFQIDEPLKEINNAAKVAIAEFEKVQQIKKSTKQSVGEVTDKVEDIISKAKHRKYDGIHDFVEILTVLRTVRGEIISLRDLRYVDLIHIQKLDEQTAEQAEKLSERCVRFLLGKNALKPYSDKVAEKQAAVDNIKKVADAKKLEEEIAGIATELDMLIEIVSNLKIEDATQTTAIIDNISSIYSSINQLRSAVSQKREKLFSTEARAEFFAQLKLIDQGIINYLDISDSPQKCDENLTKLMIQVEELEGKFPDFDEFLEQIAEKREEIYNTFESRKLQLVEKRNKRTAALQGTAQRIINGIKNRLDKFENVQEINGYFAADIMVEKVRNIIEELITLEDNVKAEDVESKLKTVKEDAIRQLRDKKDLFVDGENVIKLGNHHFAVNTQPLDLTIVNREGAMYFHITGTNFFEQIANEAFNSHEKYWEQLLISENKALYRGEYLAWLIFNIYRGKTTDENLSKQQIIDAHLNEAELLAMVKKYSADRYTEGYIKGIHAEDAAKILMQLIITDMNVDLMRYTPTERSAALLYWKFLIRENEREALYQQLKSAGILLQAFPENREFSFLIEELSEGLQAAFERHQMNGQFFADLNYQRAGEYLFYQIARRDRFDVHQSAVSLLDLFRIYLTDNKIEDQFTASIRQIQNDIRAKYILCKKWLKSFADTKNEHQYDKYLPEAAFWLLHKDVENYNVHEVTTQLKISGLMGEHNSIQNGELQLDYHEYVAKMERYFSEEVEQFNAFNQLKKELTEEFREQLKLEEYKPRVLTSFVRNKLIDKYYLPIFGNNLAKQIGSVGDNKRTDRMGMLLLISPPGYGKTTLMEYVSSRLGLTFIKVNGPALGHQIVSLDYRQVHDGAAQEELKKLNLALEMGDNIMLYLDDIQHCNPEFLQKFISLADGQRKIEGVYKDKTRTYDLRGKRVCVVMAGNPYTESGEKFKIPDMLANRADIYNLGDIAGEAEDIFKLSYIENSLTSNRYLHSLSSKSLKDVYTLLKYAETGDKELLNLEVNHAQEELNDYVSILQKLLKVRDTILRVNQEYIYSAGQADEYREEPPFKLQGSYRDMNKLSEKLVPVMNDKELQSMILAHYENEAQTLTTGAEANFLKFKVMMKIAKKADKTRWEDIKTAFKKNNALRGLGGDKLAQVIMQMSSFTEGLDAIKEVLEKGLDRDGEKT